MKMLLKLSVVVCGLFLATNLSAQCCGAAPTACAAPMEEACDQPTGDCWCRYVHWQACPYTTSRCIDVPCPCQKQCCRWVPVSCEVECCKYVPQYCTVPACRYECEYFCVPDCKTIQQTVCDQHCKYVPQYYWKHVCGESEVCCPQAY